MVSLFKLIVLPELWDVGPLRGEVALCQRQSVSDICSFAGDFPHHGRGVE